MEKLDGIAFVDIYRGTQKEYIRKWVQPLIVGIQGKPQPEFENMLENYINELIAIANFPMRLVFSRKMRRENRVTKGFDQKTNVNVLLLYWPIHNLGKHLPDKQYPKKVALLNTLRAGKATCIAKGSR